MSKKVVFFNYKAFAGSFDDAEEFYTHSSKTFVGFILLVKVILFSNFCFGLDFQRAYQGLL